MKFLWWLLSIVALAVYGWVIYDTIVTFNNPDFNIFLAYLRLSIISTVDYFIIHHLSMAIFDETIVFQIPGFVIDPDEMGLLGTLFCLTVIFLLAPVTMLLCIMYHIVGSFMALSDDY